MVGLKQKILRNLTNIPGWSSKRKIVVFESDDWGSIRMPSVEVYERLLKKGVRVDRNFFTRNDALESNSDLEMLFETLIKHRDSHGNPPVFTALSIVANPDFEAIKDSSFEKYEFEPMNTTANRYVDSDRILELWKDGLSNKVFEPQFHGREHLNVQRWMGGLEKGLPITKLGFELGLTGIQVEDSMEIREDYQAAFDIDSISENESLSKILISGIRIFKNLLGYQPRYFCPPNGPFSNHLEPIAFKNGIRFINSAKVQLEPQGGGIHKRNLRFLGEKSTSGLRYLTRNIIFEPSNPIKINWVDQAIQDVEIAFRWNKPAIISTHRVNYIGRLSTRNRGLGLEKLSLFITKLLKKWPEIEFMTSVQLGELIESTSKAK